MHTNRTRHMQALIVACILVVILAVTIGTVFKQTGLVAAKMLKPTDIANTAVTTYHNDNLRTGQNLNETILNTSNVNTKQFGKRVTYPVDGVVTAQPLFVPNVTVNGNSYNVVYVATENDSVYAFDADQINAVNPLWHTSFINPPTVTAANSPDLYSKYPYKDLFPQVGITGTPVIDLATGTLYVVAMTVEKGKFLQRLHALDIVSGKDKAGSPTLIQATIPGTGYDSVKGKISFLAKTSNQRPGLLLLNGVIYIAWGAFGDTDPYHGWVLSYTYNGHAFKQVKSGIYNDTADGQEAGIWMGGSGLAADADSNIYFTTGNGTFDANTSGVDLGDSFVKLSTQNGLQQADYFAPFNQSCLDGRDGDLGSGGVLLLPDQTGKHPHLLVGTGKEGRVYVINRDNMGHFTADAQLKCGSSEENRTDMDKVVQELPSGLVGSVFGTSGYWSGTSKSGAFVYTGGFQSQLKAFKLKNGLLSTKPASSASETSAFSGATPSISSDGNQDGTGIVWAISPSTCGFPGCTPTGPGTLRAYDATNLGKELYNTAQNATQDQLDSYTKFSIPTIANGRVFIGTRTSLTIYGLLQASSGSFSVDDNVYGKKLNQFRYIGNWSHFMNSSRIYNLYNSTYSSSKEVASTASIEFKGTRISLYGFLGMKEGIASVSIDGGNPTDLDFYSPHYSGNQLLWTSPTLSQGKHNLLITVTGRKNVKSSDVIVSLDRVAVTP